MNSAKGIIALISLILIFGSATASVSEVPRYVDLSNEEKEISFTLSNDSSLGKNLEIEVYVPTNFKIIEKPEFIGPNESEEVKILFYPNEDLYGTNYESTLIILLGSEKIEKKINFSFVKPEAKEEEEEPEEEREGIISGFVGLLSLPSLGEIDFEGISALINWELALDVFLVLVAAILLIAFIARIVTRLESSTPNIPENQTILGPEANEKSKRGMLEEIKLEKVNKLEPYNPKLEELKNRIAQEGKEEAK